MGSVDKIFKKKYKKNIERNQHDQHNKQENRIYTQKNKQDSLNFVNKNELDKVKRQMTSIPNSRFTHFLSHHDLSKFRKKKITNGNVLFVGSLTLESNFSGIQWYLRNVHPHLIGEKGQLIIHKLGMVAAKTPNRTIRITE